MSNTIPLPISPSRLQYYHISLLENVVANEFQSELKLLIQSMNTVRRKITNRSRRVIPHASHWNSQHQRISREQYKALWNTELDAQKSGGHYYGLK
ncbi:unnamed protein product [Rhizophagus irregularis]|nr:unnamed protein product [Rhizophagus irregularis]